ncbi:hypothetical protein HDV05_001035, partial [Chytridiales sp. JEL 0842]
DEDTGAQSMDAPVSPPTPTKPMKDNLPSQFHYSTSKSTTYKTQDTDSPARKQPSPYNTPASTSSSPRATNRPSSTSPLKGKMREQWPCLSDSDDELNIPAIEILRRKRRH